LCISEIILKVFVFKELSLRNEANRTPLHTAAKYGDYQGYSINYTSLSSSGNLDMVKYLLEKDEALSEVTQPHIETD
jgi:ankyrin repeat protein